MDLYVKSRDSVNTPSVSGGQSGGRNIRVSEVNTSGHIDGHMDGQKTDTTDSEHINGLSAGQPLV